MKWEQVREFASSHGLELYTPLCGCHRNLQIIDRASDRHWWAENKAKSAMQSLQAIVQQRQLSRLSNEQAIADGIAAKESII